MISANDVRLHVDDGGRGGVPVVFVHGLAGDSDMWDAQLRHLRSMRRAVALDLRGHGRSSLPANGDCRIETLARDVLAAAASLGLSRYVLVGHSLGGSVILEASRLEPDCVAGLVFVDPAGDVSRLPADRRERMLKQLNAPTYRTFMEGWFGGNLYFARPPTRDRVLRDLGRTSPKMVAACYAALAAYDPAPALAAFGGPMVTVVRDCRERPHSFQCLMPELPDALLPGVSHWMMMDDPDAFNALLDAFLELIR